MDLTQAMLAATDSPPPTGIDVDRLITGERRRARRLHTVAGVALAAVLVAGAVTVPSLLSRTPSGQSPGLAPPSTVAGATSRAPALCVTPSPTVDVPSGGNGGKQPAVPRPLMPVTESCGAAIARLGDALTALLPRLAPGVPFTNVRDGSALPAKFMKANGPQLEYSAAVRRQGGSASVIISAAEKTPQQYLPLIEEQCAHPQGGCRRASIDGAELLIRNPGGGYGIDVWAYRPDGTMVLTLARAAVAGQPVPFTEQQLIDLAMAPELTLYP